MKKNNTKKKGFFLKKYSKVIPELKNSINVFDEDTDSFVEKSDGFNTFEVVGIIFISVLFGVIVGCMLSYGKNTFTGKPISKELNEFINTYDSIIENYYDDISEKELVNAAISGMVGSLNDPYSVYMDDSMTEDFNQTVDGEYVGIGVTVSFANNKNEIIEVMPKSPAEKAGFMVGDIIIAVGDKNVENIFGDDLTKYIKGKVGTKVKIKVLRGDKEKTLTVERKVIELESVYNRVIDNGSKKVGVIKVTNFAANTSKQFKKALTSLEKKKVDSLIIDVRGNPGGHLSQATDILSMFFDKKTVLYQMETKGKKTKIYSSTDDSRDYPIVLLVDGGSASASEIIASCFKENYKKATIVGGNTYGKGTVQKAVQLSGGASIKYTTQKWLTSKGKWINDKGIEPDHVVALPEGYCDDPSDANDSQLQKALELLK